MKSENKIIAMYLPQYHKIPENSKWWGEGFTDWDAVKGAEKLYQGHIQPRVPLDKKYYDLLNKDTLRWQASLLQEYDIDGLCFYHYCFKNNKMLLEKPAELLLKNPDIKMPFCFCWANESWVNSWSEIGNNNVWSYKYGSRKDSTGEKYLIEQQYGDVSQWWSHFKYLLPFFLDKRYIKVEGKPLFILYKPNLISCLEEMKKYWYKWALENGLDGIYIIGANCDKESMKYVDANYFHEPLHTNNMIAVPPKKDKLPVVIDYDDIWRGILSHTPTEIKTYFGGFVGYDDTPRHGVKGSVIYNRSPEKFKYYLAELIAKNSIYENTITFVNAWNEWGEGMYLEPDEVDKYEYLEAVRYAKKHYIDYVSKYEIKKRVDSIGLFERYSLLNSELGMSTKFFTILNKWLLIRENNISLQDALVEQGMNKVAIYGIGILGKHLYEEISTNVKYILDKNIIGSYKNTKIYNIQDELPEVDGVVVAVNYDYQEIMQQLNGKGLKKIILLEELIDQIVKEKIEDY